MKSILKKAKSSVLFLSLFTLAAVTACSKGGNRPNDLNGGPWNGDGTSQRKLDCSSPSAFDTQKENSLRNEALLSLNEKMLKINPLMQKEIRTKGVFSAEVNVNELESTIHASSSDSAQISTTPERIVIYSVKSLDDFTNSDVDLINVEKDCVNLKAIYSGPGLQELGLGLGISELGRITKIKTDSIILQLEKNPDVEIKISNNRPDRKGDSDVKEKFNAYSSLKNLGEAPLTVTFTVKGEEKLVINQSAFVANASENVGIDTLYDLVLRAGTYAANTLAFKKYSDAEYSNSEIVILTKEELVEIVNATKLNAANSASEESATGPAELTNEGSSATEAGTTVREDTGNTPTVVTNGAADEGAVSAADATVPSAEAAAAEAGTTVREDAGNTPTDVVDGAADEGAVSAADATVSSAEAAAAEAVVADAVTTDIAATGAVTTPTLKKSNLARLIEWITNSAKKNAGNNSTATSPPVPAGVQNLGERGSIK